MSVTIRPMLSDDLERVAEIDRLSFPLSWHKDAFRYELTNPVAICRVAEVREAGLAPQVAGVMVTWVVLDEAEVASISVHPELRRRGIAHMLMESTLRTCAELDIQRVFLEVRRSNLAAQALYLSFGFEMCDVRRGYYADNQEDALVMVRKTTLPDPMNENGLSHFQAKKI